jgi:hypothetical protein
MTVAILLNSIFAAGIVVALAVVCRIPYRLAAEQLEHRPAQASPSRRDERERLAA